MAASLDALEFTTPVTFFVGENGSGKSTVLEGIAAGMKAIAVGSAEVDKDQTLQAAREFASGFRFERRRQPRTKLLFRAEDIFGFTRRMLHSMKDLASIEDEFRREFAPYFGVTWERKFFGTADLARSQGEDPAKARLTVGVRTWF